MRSGSKPKCWCANHSPVRPKPPITSSATSRMSYLRQIRWISGQYVDGGKITPPAPWNGSPMNAATFSAPARGSSLRAAARAERFRRFAGRCFAEEIRLIDVHDVLDLRRHLLVHVAHPAERAAGDRRAVIAVLARDHVFLLRLALHAPVLVHEPQHGVVAFRAAVAVEEVVEAGRRDFREHRGKLDHRRVRGLEERVVERQFLDLAIRGVGEFLAAVADVHAPEAGHPVDHLVAVGVPQVDAVGLHDHAAACAVQRTHVGERVDVVRGVERAVFGGRAGLRRTGSGGRGARCGRLDPGRFVAVRHVSSVIPYSVECTLRRAAADGGVPTS